MQCFLLEKLNFFKNHFQGKTFSLSLPELVPLRNEAQEGASKTTLRLSRAGACGWAGRVLLCREPSSCQGCPRLQPVTRRGHRSPRMQKISTVVLMQNELLFPGSLFSSRADTSWSVLPGEYRGSLAGLGSVATSPALATPLRPWHLDFVPWGGSGTRIPGCHRCLPHSPRGCTSGSDHPPHFSIKPRRCARNAGLRDHKALSHLTPIPFAISRH